MDLPVLVLNANYEPLNVCHLRRAMGLLLTGKAAMVANGRGYIYTVSQALPCPSVIRLELMIHRPRPRVQLTRTEIFRRDNYTCQYCGKTNLPLTVDHIIPRHLRGQHVWENVATACASCNHLKGGRRLEETPLRLSRIPKEPPASAKILLGRYLHDNNDWTDYLAGW